MISERPLGPEMWREASFGAFVIPVDADCVLMWMAEYASEALGRRRGVQLGLASRPSVSVGLLRVHRAGVRGCDGEVVPACTDRLETSC